MSIVEHHQDEHHHGKHHHGESTWWDTEGPVPPTHDSSNLTRNWFPKDFIFGTGTAAYQVEGYAQKGGRGISLWDEYAMRTPDRIADGSNGNVACGMYTRYKEDIKLMKKMGFDSYRFSISWPRILPGGRTCNGVNQEGIDYYNDVINTVIENGMIPFVTIFHWDLPITLEKEYGGFLCKKIKDDFREYAELCFWEFGDRVKHWTTINEPWTFAAHGYVTGTTAPGKKVPVADSSAVKGPAAEIPKIRAQAPTKTNRKVKDHTVATPSEAYTVGRNLLLAHAEAVDLYRTKFQEAQKGKIGIVLVTHYFFPLNKDSEADKLAVKRALDFMLGWFLEPILYGRYPKSMLESVPPDNLASFTAQDVKKLQGSIDFLGLNYYTTQYAADVPNPVGEGYAVDQRVNFTTVDKHDVPIGTASGSEWLFSVPTGLYGILTYLHDTYPELKEIYITENGFSVKNDPKKTAKMVCADDNDRIKYHQDHLVNILKAMKDDVFDKVKGYYVWTFCDNYEWGGGYTVRFGLVYIDYINNLTRYPKDSCAWFAKFLKSGKEPPKWYHPWWKPTLLGDKRVRQVEGQNGPEDKRLKAVENMEE